MRSWIGIIVVAALAVGIGSPEPILADDDAEDFVILGRDPDDFRPRSEAASSGPLFFVGGSTRLTDAATDAAILGLDERDGSEVWRASEGEPDVPESFTVVGTAAGRVCAAGSVVNSLNPVTSLRELLVSCYSARRGKRLWVRRLELDPVRFQTVVGPLMHVSDRAVVLTVSSLTFGFQENLVLRFDARDGSGR